MARQTVRIEGIDDAINKLGAIRNGAAKATDTAVKAAALVVENRAKNKIRRGYLLQSGNLKRSITHKRKR